MEKSLANGTDQHLELTIFSQNTNIKWTWLLWNTATDEAECCLPSLEYNWESMLYASWRVNLFCFYGLARRVTVTSRFHYYIRELRPKDDLGNGGRLVVLVELQPQYLRRWRRQSVTIAHRLGHLNFKHSVGSESSEAHSIPGKPEPRWIWQTHVQDWPQREWDDTRYRVFRPRPRRHCHNRSEHQWSTDEWALSCPANEIIIYCSYIEFLMNIYADLSQIVRVNDLLLHFHNEQFVPRRIVSDSIRTAHPGE